MNVCVCVLQREYISLFLTMFWLIINEMQVKFIYLFITF